MNPDIIRLVTAVCLFAGFCSLLAAYRSRGWLLPIGKLRRLADRLGPNGPTTVYTGMGVVFLAVAAAIVSRQIQRRYFPFQGPIVEIATAWPGHGADEVVAAVAEPLEHQFAEYYDIVDFYSESRANGSYRAWVQATPDEGPRYAWAIVFNQKQLSIPIMPKEVRQRDFTINVAEPARKTDRQISLAVVPNSVTNDPADLHSAADAILTLLLSAGALINPEPLVDQRPSPSGFPPRLIFRYKQRPAVLLRGASPDGLTVANAASRCVQLIGKERAKRSEWARIQLVNLTR